MKACRTEGIYEREAKALKLLSEDSLIKIPKVYFTFQSTDTIPMDFIAMEELRGTNCYTDYIKLLNSKKRKQFFADEITQAVHHWHERTNDRFGPIDNAVYDDWLDYYGPFATDVLNSAEQLAKNNELDVEVVDVMKRAWLIFDYLFSEKIKAPSLVHGDMNVMNIISNKSLRELAVIDPFESKWADSEYELFQFRSLTGDLFFLYDTYKANYPVSEKCDIKTAFYALYHEIYVYIISGKKVDSNLKALVKNLKKELDNHSL